MKHLHFPKNKDAGFTLLELLVALFIFSILSTILVAALQSVINAYTESEKKADRLRSLQRALLILSRDIEQTTFRPIVNTVGKEEPAFVGTMRGFSFTHFGVGDPSGNALTSAMQRVDYHFSERSLWRTVYRVLDQAPQTQAKAHPLLENVSVASFQYVDKQQRLHSTWPIEGENNKEPLPRAVKINLTIPHWGKLSQLYVISADPKTLSATPSS